MTADGARAARQPDSAPIALWAALVLAAAPRIYLMLPGGDSADTFLVPLVLFVVVGYFVVARRSEVAYWLFLLGLGLGIYLELRWGVNDAYRAFVLSCGVSAVIFLVLPQTRLWVGLR